jgi:hypothetical protein
MQKSICVGDKLKITDCKYRHAFLLGEIVTVAKYNLGGYLCYNNNYKSWFVFEGEFEKIENDSTPTIKKGDIVRVVKEPLYNNFSKGDIVVIYRKQTSTTFYAVREDGRTSLLCLDEIELASTEIKPELNAEKEGFLNRHLTPLPDKDCDIVILDDDLTIVCKWEYSTSESKDYLGTATAFDHSRIFIAHSNNGDGFTYYRILK